MGAAIDDSGSQAAGSRARYGFAVCASIAVVYALWLLLAWPRGDFPLNDDWAYAWSVRHLLETGELRISQWAAAAAIVPVYWGALFSQLAGGFSFTALRVSTLVFSLMSPVALFWLLRRVGIPRSAALLGVLTLLVNPLFVHLSYTFMTDVFYLGLMVVGLALYVGGIERDSARSLWAASITSALAFLCRQLGLALPLAAVVVLVARKRREAVGPALRAALIPALVFMVYTLWLNRFHGVTWGFQLNVVQNGLAKLLRASTPVEMWGRVLYTLLYLGIFTLPALMATVASGHLDGQRVRRLVWPFTAWFLLLVGVSAYGYVTRGSGMPYLDGVLDRDGVGALTLQGRKPRVTPAWVFDLVTLVAPLAGAAQATLWMEWLRNARREILSSSAVLPLSALVMGALTLPMVDLWDEYLLVFIPASLYLALREARLSPRSLVTGALVCVVMLTYVLREQADYLAWNTARWEVGRRLVGDGVAPIEIGGGFEWVGWYDFEKALPIALAAGHGDNMFDWYNVLPDRYFMAFEPLGVERGRRTVLGVVRYSTRFGPGGEIYALDMAKP